MLCVLDEIESTLTAALTLFPAARSILPLLLARVNRLTRSILQSYFTVSTVRARARNNRPTVVFMHNIYQHLLSKALIMSLGLQFSVQIMEAYIRSTCFDQK